MRALAIVMVLGLAGCSGSPAGDAELPAADVAADVAAPPALPFDWCVPGERPDEACYASKRDPDSANVARARDIADAFLAKNPPESMGWGWEAAVLMIGVLELHLVTGEEAYLDYPRAWMDHHIDAGYSIGHSDSCVPAGVAVLLLHLTGDPRDQGVIDDALVYMHEKAVRSEGGGLSHLGTMDYATLWVDSLFMLGNVLFRLGELFDDASSLDFYGDQFRIFTEALQEEGGFFRHADRWLTPQTDGVWWGRGNGWVSVAGAWYLRVRALRGEDDGEVLDAVSRLNAAAMDAQDPGTGLWWTIVNRPGETYLETSAAALFAAGMARLWRIGLAGDEVLSSVHAAMDGVRDRIVTGADGLPVVTGVSGPTTVGTFEEYAAVETVDDVPFGVGAVLLALLETSGLPEPGID
ncbi:MAG: glycoside hydrolase family 88 protein [Deltaproteobacteria bacterium]|nr:glycoside hydrolase family 88 protein [Deltaproteobacteria bacterium]